MVCMKVSCQAQLQGKRRPFLSCREFSGTSFKRFFFQKLDRIIDRILVIPPDAPPFWLSPIHRPIPCVATVAGRFGNYIVQRVIALAQLPQRDMLFWKLREHLPVLKKSNTRLAAVVIFDGSPGEVLAFSLAKHEWNMNRT